MKILRISLLVSMTFLCGNLLSADTPDFINDCMDCHGKNGVSVEPDVPSIAGISATFIEETFAAYQYDMRNAVESKYRLGDTSRAPTDMKKIAKKLSEDQIIEAANYFAAKPFVAAKQDFDKSLVTKGEKVHIRKCEKCHQNGGSGVEEDAAILAGQWTPYLRNAIKHIVDESRDVDMEMTKKVEKLTDAEWDALLSFYASQQ